MAGVTDGTWSLIDAILHLQGRSNAKKLAIATWTAAKSNIEQARRLERLSGCQIRFLVDRSFQTRQPGYCQFLRDTFGDEVIRVWSSHAKFVLFLDGDFDILLTSSANLNQNKRVENYLCLAEHPGGPVVADYLRLVEGLFLQQASATGSAQSKQGREDTAMLFAPTAAEDQSYSAGIGSCCAVD